MLNGSRHPVLLLLPTAHDSIINDQTAKARSLGIKHVSLFFFGKSLSTTDITPVVCCHEKGLQFSQEIGAAEIHTPIEN